MNSRNAHHMVYWFAIAGVVCGYIVHEGLTHFECFKEAQFLPFVELVSPAAFFTFFYWLFENWGWKFQPFCKLLNVPCYPNLNGNWHVTGSSVSSLQAGVVSNWEGEASIRQKFSEIFVRLETNQSNSLSQVAIIGYDGGQFLLLYEYLNEPKKDAPSTMSKHRGTSRLLWSGEKLEGSYYTENRDRGTDGTLSFSRAK